MRPSKVFIVTAGLVLGAALSVVPLQVAGAQAPSTSIILPSNPATVSGTSQVLDAIASSPFSQTTVQFEITGGTLTDSVIATAVPTYYGWIALWNTTTVANGPYTLQSVASSNGTSGTSTAITITVDNPPPSTTVLVPASGATLNTEQNEVFDAGASPGVTGVSIKVVVGGNTLVGFTATQTFYGWIVVVPAEGCSGCSPESVSASIQSVATYSGGVSGTSPPVGITLMTYIKTPP